MEANGTIMQYFEWYLNAEASLWKQVAEEAGELAAHGISAVWLPPAYKGAGGIHDVGYGVYDIYDLGEFEQKGSIPTKYGTKQEYLDAILKLQNENIQVYADIVLNHKMGADETEEISVRAVNRNDRDEDTSGVQNILAWTKYTFPGRNGKYSDFTWNASHFSGVDWDERSKTSQIYRIEGKHWNDDVDTEHDNYDYLMGTDLDFDNREVLQELETWGKWYLETTHVDGLRLDAVKHIDSDFYREWLTKMRTHMQKELFAMGEYWKPDKYSLEYYLSEVVGNMSLFDVPLHFNFFRASKEKEGFDLRKLFEGSLAAENPMKAVTFVDNHDTQPGQALQSYIEPWFRTAAYSLILLRRAGYPCVFYGDYYGIPHDGIAALPTLKNMLRVRKECVYGPQHDYFDDYHVVGWTYEGDLEHGSFPVAVIISNMGQGRKKMYVGIQHAGETFTNLCAAIPEIVVIDSEGNGEFITADKSAGIYITLS